MISLTIVPLSDLSSPTSMSAYYTENYGTHTLPYPLMRDGTTPLTRQANSRSSGGHTRRRGQRISDHP